MEPLHAWTTVSSFRSLGRQNGDDSMTGLYKKVRLEISPWPRPQRLAISGLSIPPVFMLLWCSREEEASYGSHAGGRCDFITGPINTVPVGLFLHRLWKPDGSSKQFPQMQGYVLNRQLFLGLTRASPKLWWTRTRAV